MDTRRAHERLDKLEIIVNNHTEALENLGTSITENTVLTKQIADNADEIVSLFKGSKVLYKIIIGAASLVGLLYAFAEWVHK